MNSKNICSYIEKKERAREENMAWSLVTTITTRNILNIYE
jgi:hypothetical protein